MTLPIIIIIYFFVKFDCSKRCTGHDLLYFVLTIGSPRANKRGDIRALQYDNPT